MLTNGAERRRIAREANPMSYRIGWGAGARHYASSAETASEALGALRSLELYCQIGVVVIADGIGEVPREALEYIAASERAAAGDAHATEKSDEDR